MLQDAPADAGDAGDEAEGEDDEDDGMVMDEPGEDGF